MIDLWLVASSSLWIAGLALLLASISWASWAASQEGARLRTLLARPGARRAWGLGCALFCAGMAATSRAWWESVLWGVLAVTLLVFALVPGAVDRLTKKEGSP